ncbi:Clavesin-2 [Araneus ventricosus]|uniref:Clavesin-2 n=1 Tax=Araneus ventricosus TaxID=182803 RepID=A0A4Y2NY44_ARAVE|nr:Clavesin-2 [Araneus ventricosus]
MAPLHSASQAIKYACLEATTLEENILKTIQEEIGETEESRTECLRTLRGKLKELEDIECCLDEDFLLKFLRVAKFDCEKAFDRIKGYYKMQEKLIHLLKNTSITISKIENMKYSFALPYRPEDNSAVTVIRMGIIDYSKMTFDGRSFLDIIATGYLLNNPITQICGITSIFDFTGFKFRSLLAVNPKTAFDYMYTVQKAFPLRIKAFHIVNAPSIFWAFYRLFYPAMSEKLRSRVFVHPNNDNWESLHTCIPPEILPEDLGGCLPKSRLVDLLENAEILENDMLEQSRFGYKKTKHVRMSMKIIVPDK